MSCKFGIGAIDQPPLDRSKFTHTHIFPEIYKARLRINRVSPFPIASTSFYSIENFPAEFDNVLYQQNRVDLPPRVSLSVIKRRKEYFFGRLCAREAVRFFLPDFTDQIRTGSGGVPQFPGGLAGSITHDADGAAAICQPAEFGSLGLDMEPAMSAALAEELWMTVATREELALLCWRDAIKSLRLTLIFSAKEALFKAIYPEILCIPEFLTSAVINVNWTAGYMTLRLEKNLGGGWDRGRIILAYFVVDEGRVLTLVSTKDGAT